MKFIAAIALVALLISPVLGADFSVPIVDDKGVPIMAPGVAGGPSTPVTLGSVSSQALFAVFPDEQTLPEQEKFQRGMLGLKIGDSKGDMKLSAEQIALIKKLIAKAYSPLIVARAWALLDPSVAQ